MNLSKLWNMVKDRESRCAAVRGVTKSWTWLSNWTTTRIHYIKTIISSSLWHCFISLYKGYYHQTLDFPGSSDGKASAYNVADLGSIHGWEDPLEKEMATHSSTLAWRIPWMEEPGGLKSMASQRVGHDWATSLSLSPPDIRWHTSTSFIYY